METEKFIKYHEAQQKARANSLTSRSPKPDKDSLAQSPQPNSTTNSDGTVSSDTTAQPTTEPPPSDDDFTRRTFPEVIPTIRHDIKALSPYEIIGIPFIYEKSSWTAHYPSLQRRIPSL